MLDITTRIPCGSVRHAAAATAWRVLALACSLLSVGLLPRTAQATDFYVSPAATASGAGTLANPWTLAAAFQTRASAVRPGDTVWLRGGTYGSGGPTVAYSYLAGSATRPIYVRQYQGERATINGGLAIAGNYVWYWGFEVANLNWPWPRSTNDSGSFPSGKPPEGIFFVQGVTGCKIINMIVHDSANGLVDQQESTASEVYGNLSYNNGWTAPDRGHGHGLYLQNASSVPKLVTNNITYNSFDIGIQAYGVAGPVAHLHLDGNVSFNAGLPAGHRVDNLIFASAGVQRDIRITNEVSYNPLDAPFDNTGYNEMDATWNSGLNLDLTIQNSFWVGATPTRYETLLLRNWQSLVFKGNTVVGPLVVENVTSNDWSGNTYYNALPPPGIDSSSPVYNHNPIGVTVIVQPNKYEPGRAHIAVLNWDRNATVPVDISTSGLAVGTQFEIRDSQNFWGTPVLSGTYDGSPLVLPMTLTQVSSIVGGYPTPPHTSAEFNAFILLPKGTPPATPPPGPPGPLIALSAPSMTFSGYTGAAAPASQNLIVTNSGTPGTTLNWTAVSSQGWLSITPASGQLGAGASLPLIVSVSTAALVAGTYQGTLTFADPNGDNTPQTVSVTLTLSMPPPPSGQSFVTGLTSGSLRNDFSGWVGLRLALGPSPITVSALGRLKAPGNTRVHTVKLVDATGVDVTGGSVAIPMSGGVAGNFVYGGLASPVVLAANSAYYLASQEIAGQDKWYDFNTSVQTTAEASVTQGAYFDTSWHVVGGAGQTYGPPNLGYTLGGTVTPPPSPPGPPDGQAFVARTTLGRLRNDFSGWVGLRLTVGSTPMTVSALARMKAPGNTGTHTVKLVNAATDADVPGASVSIPMAGGDQNSFVYLSLASPVVLAANSAYYLASQEAAAQDAWYDLNTGVQTTAAASVTHAAYFDTRWRTIGGSNSTYGSPNMAYTLGGSVPPLSPPPDGQAFLTGTSLGTVRRDYTGWVGMKIQIGSGALTVTGLGRIVAPGDIAAHMVKIVSATTGQDVPGASASVATAGGAGGAFAYGALASSIVLAANTAYYVVTQEVAGGDPWYDLNTSVQTTNAATVVSAVFSSGSSYFPMGYSGQSYGPVNFLYQTGTITPPGGGTSAAASFLKIDSATKGTWNSVYGVDGRAIAGDLAQFPAYAQVAFVNASSWTWASSTPDLRAPQKASNSKDRIAAAWYAGTAFLIDINLTDSQSHRLALYALDWDNGPRTERVEVLDAASQSVLDSRTFSSFSQGQYLVWNIQGHVTLRLTNQAGSSAVVSGIFLGGL